MAPTASVSEIVECREINPPRGHKKPASIKPIIEEMVSISRSRHPSDNELIRLFEALDLKKSSRDLNPSSQAGEDVSSKRASKKPAAGVGATSQAPGTAIGEPVSLKQALRKLSISHASAMAATKRLQKPTGLSDFSEAGTIQRLYATVVVQTSEKSQGEKEKQDVLEIHIVPETPLPERTEQKGQPSQTLNSHKASEPSTCVGATATVPKLTKAKSRTMNVSKSVTVKSKPRAGTSPRVKGKLKRDSSTEGEAKKKTVSSIVIKPTFKNRSNSRRKKDKGVPSVAEKSCSCNGAGRICSSPSEDKQVQKEVIKQVQDEEIKQVQEVVILSNTTGSYGVPYSGLLNDSRSNRLDSTPSGCSNTPKAMGPKPRKQPRSREKGECSHSSKSSIGDFSASTSFSSESLRSGSSGFNSRPHMSKDVRWIAIRNVEMQYGAIGLRNFKLLKRLGCGDIGTVYLAELIGTDCLFALKVMDNEFLLSRKKMLRAQTEREILQMLDHPFLPTLYTFFTTDNLSCLVMEYCPGGDLHVLRQQQPARCFPEPAARFYVAEVLLALEYLHMLGVVYRDLKPENILVREDGHIMLSDFDLSLRCSVCPTLLKSSSLGFGDAARVVSGPCTESSCIDPLCLQPSWVPGSCFTPTPKTKKQASEFGIMGGRLPQVVVEPTEARSNSFVGTHEYLAPEIIKGEGHGSSVDWWTFGIFLYELLFGHTPFKGHTNEETLANVVTESLMFPESPTVSFHAIDLIRGLLAKEPEYRLGSIRGAAEIKQHPFFRGLNWALIRCALPPEIPGPCSFGIIEEMPQKKVGKSLEFRTGNGGGVEFELF